MLVDTYISNALIPKRYQGEIKLVPAKVDEQTFIELNNIKTNIVDFVNKGNNLLICSNSVGNGKTTMATKLLKEYIKSVGNINFKNSCPGLFINITNFLNEKKLAISDKALQERILDTEHKILSARLVVFDDLGVKNLSEYDLCNVYYWIDERTNNMRSSIYTSNLLPEQLKGILDERLYSRIVNYSIIKQIKDGDNRAC